MLKLMYITNRPEIARIAERHGVDRIFVDLETLGDALGMTLPLDEEYGTLGGLVFSTFSFIPEDGSTPEVTVAGLKVKVEEICDHRIEKALVSKELIQPETTDEAEDNKD